MGFLPSILDEHADEAIALAGLRSRAVDGLTATLPELLRLDYRLDANLDGLRLAGDAGWQMCERLLREEPAAGAFSAAVVALSSGSASRLQQIVDAACGDQRIACGLESALVWLPLTKVEEGIASLLRSDGQMVRNAALAALARHGVDPGGLLREAIRSCDAHDRAPLLRAAGELGRTDLMDLLHGELSSRHHPCRFWAAWSITLLAGSLKAGAVLESFAQYPGPYRETAVAMLWRRYGGSNQATSTGLHSHRSARLRAVAGAAYGHSSAVPLLVEQMRDPRTARFAGEAFTAITGAGIVSLSAAACRPQGFEAGPSDDPRDENVELDPDDGLPWPDAEAVAAWWEHHQSRFDPEIRYLLGKPVSEEWMYEILRDGRQGHRRAASVELSMLRPGSMLFDVRAPAFRQRQQLCMDSGPRHPS